MDGDELRRQFSDSLRLLSGDVDIESRLLYRGWIAADLDVPDADHLTWLWPPTRPDPGHLPEGLERTYRPVSPWLTPTQIVRDGERWRVEYGSTSIRDADPSQLFESADELLEAIRAIECWPMDLDEAERLRARRIVSKLTNDAHDQFSLAVHIGQPYADWLNDLREHEVYEWRTTQDPATKPPLMPAPKGNRYAMAILIEADGYVAAVRTSRVGGQGWA